MGLDVKDVRVVVNVGIPSSDWVLKQQSGRAGRDGKQAVTVSLCRRARKPKNMAIGAKGNTHASISYISNFVHIIGDRVDSEVSSVLEGSTKGISSQMRAILAGSSCIRVGLHNLFTVKDPYRKL